VAAFATGRLQPAGGGLQTKILKRLWWLTAASIVAICLDGTCIVGTKG
jgi:hypothetical protein